MARGRTSALPRFRLVGIIGRWLDAQGESDVLTAEQNDLLCRVAGDAPMGALMKRYWLPACLIADVAATDGAPFRTRVADQIS